MKCWKHLVALSVVLGLAACATLPPSSKTPAPAFDLNGRLAVHTQAQAFSGAVRWISNSNNAGSDELWINTPMGQGVAHVYADDKSATLTTAEQKQYHSDSIEKLTQKALGWRLPVAPLRFWVQGEASPDLPQQDIQRDAQARLTQLTQNEWHVIFVYTTDASKTPARIEITSADAVLKFVIDRLEAAQ